MKLLRNIHLLVSILCAVSSLLSKPAFASEEAIMNTRHESSQPFKKHRATLNGSLIVLNMDSSPSADEAVYAVHTDECNIQVDFRPLYLVSQASQNYGKFVRVKGYFRSEDARNAPCQNIMIATDIVPLEMEITGKLIALNLDDARTSDKAVYALRTSKCNLEVSFNAFYLLPQAGQYFGENVTVQGYYLTHDGLMEPCKNILIVHDIGPLK